MKKNNERPLKTDTLPRLSDGKGKGATFRIRLPLVPAAMESGSDDGAPQPSIAEKQPTEPLRILVVEDQGDTADMLRILLEAEGHHIQVACSAAAAIEAASRDMFDLVISDLGLPDSSGLDLMKHLRKEFGLKGIAVTGYGTQDDFDQTRDAGFTEHLVKPIDLEQLEAAIPRAVSSL